MTNTVHWSLALRLWHWALALSVIANFWLLEEGDPAHRYTGYFALILVGIRLVWGWLATDTSSFKEFSFKVAKKPLTFRHPAHNRMASLVYVLMWVCVGALGVTGFMMGLDAFWGDETLEEIHSTLANTLMALVGVHLVGIALDSIRHKRPTYLAMWRGTRERLEKSL